MCKASCKEAEFFRKTRLLCGALSWKTELFFVFHRAVDVSPFRDEVVEDDSVLKIALSVIVVVEDTRQPLIEDFCVRFVNIILAQTVGEIYQFLVIALIRSDKNMVIDESQICVDKARLQRYNEHIRSNEFLFISEEGRFAGV